MHNPSRLALAAFVAALLASPVFAGNTTKPVVKIAPVVVGAPEIALRGISVTGLNPGKIITGNAVTIPGSGIMQAPTFQNPAQINGGKPVTQLELTSVVNMETLRQQIAAPVAAAIQPGAIAPAIADVTEGIVGVEKALQNDSTAGNVEGALDQVYFGKHGRNRGFVSGGGSGNRDAKAKKDPSQSAVFIVNDEGVEINGRAAEYYKEAKRLVAKYEGKIDMSESLDVMDDTYAAVHAKLKVIESVAHERQIADHNTHLEQTLVWVDGTMTDNSGKRIAIHTHQVYFHHAPAGPNKEASEVAEGNRRTDKHIEEMEKYFARNGKAEQSLGPLDEIVMGFDTRGYAGIKNHLKEKEKMLAKKYGKKFRFVYLDEVANVPKSIVETRAQLNQLVKKYKQHGLQKIIEGVIYSRYVGLLLELKTLEHYHEAGYKILQAGHELFDSKTGHYITELDTVVRSPEGKVIVVEAKSARVSLEFEKALQDKILYKLDTYQKNRAEMEKLLGAKIDEIVFAVDVGSEEAFKTFLESKQEELSERYGMPVSFLFVSSGPEELEGAGAPHGKKKKKR